MTLLAGLILHPSSVVEAATPISGPVIVRPGGAQLYDAPDGEVVATLSIGTVFTATARTEDMSWIMGHFDVGQPCPSRCSTSKGVSDAGVDATQACVACVTESGWLQVAQVIAVGVELLPVYGDATQDCIACNEVEATATATLTESVATAEETPVASDAGAAVTDIDATQACVACDEAAVTGTVTSGDDRLNVRSGPGTAYSIIAKALPGESYPVVGRTEDGAWLQIERGDEGTGWVSAAYLQLSGEITQIPIVTAISPPEAVIPVAATQTAAPSGAAVFDVDSHVPARPATVAGAATATSKIFDLSGTLVIQSSPGGMIYAYLLNSGALWPLANGFDPAISPDGQTVAFVRDGGENGIYLINIDGSNERLIWSGRTRLSSPKWSPDGQWILFTRSDGSYECIETRGSCISPPSGPNGEQVGLPGLETSTHYWYNLARVDRDGNNYRDIASLTSARAADWNEAGIVYQSDAGLQITADTPDAENKLVIFDYLKPYFDDPDWQPNGGKIVYMGKEASHWELFTVNPDGSGKTSLTRPATTIVDVIPSNVAPAWSPDGQHILFLSNREANHEAGVWRVWVMDADGSNQRVLPIDLEINYTFGGEQSLSWVR